MSEPIIADYIVIGAGSAGCVLANRLSGKPGVKVLLLEAGGDDRPARNPAKLFSNLMIGVPAGFGRLVRDESVNWMYQTEADEPSGGRKHIWPRGRVLGGSSAINGLIYIRGQQADYDNWRQMGCRGWGFEDVLPYFKRAENQERGANEWHGAGGPLNVSDISGKHPVSAAQVQACVEAGIPYSEDINAARQEGVTWAQLTVKKGRRVSAATAYLHPAMKRPNLRVETNALAARILFKGKRATGVEFWQGTERRRAEARAEIILAAGAIASPQLLELSGIGQATRLREFGLAAVADSPGVGENLHDHYMIPMRWRLKAGTQSLNELSRGPLLAQEILRYLTVRKGILTYGACHGVAFARSRPELDLPDVQFLMMAASVDYKRFAKVKHMPLEDQPGMTMNPSQLRPQSRGSLHIRSMDPSVPPTIRPNYLASPIDQQTILSGVKLVRSIAAQPALAAYKEFEIAPGGALQRDDELLDYCRRAGVTLHHAVGTCRMGSDDGSVVDPDLRVRGIEGLRVADASIMPAITSGNTNAPVIMIAEKAAHLIVQGSR